MLAHSALPPVQHCLLCADRTARAGKRYHKPVSFFFFFFCLCFGGLGRKADDFHVEQGVLDAGALLNVGPDFVELDGVGDVDDGDGVEPGSVSVRVRVRVRVRVAVVEWEKT